MKEPKGAAAFRRDIYQIIDRAIKSGGLEHMRRLSQLFELCIVAQADSRMERCDRRVLMQFGLLTLLHDGNITEKVLAEATALPRTSVRGILEELRALGYLTAAKENEVTTIPTNNKQENQSCHMSNSKSEPAL